MINREVLGGCVFGLEFGEQDPRAEPTQCAAVWHTWLASCLDTGAGPKSCIKYMGRD